MTLHARRLAALIAVLTVGACAAPKPTSPASTRRPAASRAPSAEPTAIAPPTTLASPRPIDQAGTARTLTGLVTLISDKGGAVISDHGGAILSNNTGNLIGNHGGGLIGNNAGSYRLAQAAGEARLAEAVITVQDAKGRTLTDAAGAPLTATTDATGRYAFEAVLPDENLVLRIRLWNGGELAALLTKDAGGELAIDTAATLGATYVMTQYVKGDQATYDKLPTTEATRLTQAIAGVRSLITTVPDYRPEALVALADDLRKRAPALDETFEDIKVLLLGGLGDGLPATGVALSAPCAIAVAPDGAFFIGEFEFGRVRRVAPDGTLTTYLDSAAGTVKGNASNLTGLARGADGALFVASEDQQGVFRVKPGSTAFEAFVRPDAGLVPGAIAVDATTLYVGDLNAARLVAVDLATGARTEVPLPPELPAKGGIRGLAVGADGTLDVLPAGKKSTSTLYRRRNGAWSALATGLAVDKGGLAAGPDGTLYAAEDLGRRVLAFAPDGTRRVLLEAADDPFLKGPGALAVGADGTLHVVDRDRNLVFTRSPAGAWRVVAGSTTVVQAADGSLAINSPTAVAFDATGGMLVAEGAGHAIQRWDGKALTRIAGDGRGYAGDGGPALDARFDAPTSLAYRGAELLVFDAHNDCIRSVGADGVVRTLLGAGTNASVLAKGEARDPATHRTREGGALLPAPDGSLYWAASGANQIARQRPDGKLEAVAGSGGIADDGGDGGDARDARLNAPLGLGLRPDGAALVVSDTANSRLRLLTGLAPGETPRLAPFAGLGRDAMLGRLLALTPGVGLADEGVLATEALVVVPTAVAVDPATGTVYFAEAGTRNVADLTRWGNASVGAASTSFALLPAVPSRLRKVTPDGRIHTIAGPGGALWNDPEAADALGLPMGLAFDPQGRLVVVDARTNAIRFIPKGQY